eukprot:TRINITY_DN48941_c0_g1_i1.p1 TRINITY_DN48941_c0_g1~~TRINITY_DN48941_c0_g1_i1.p1  ORF type:complete len:106 (+),score=6.61 TRINITY_DN48941_c0_g1_i1:21-338(+)
MVDIPGVERAGVPGGEFSEQGAAGELVKHHVIKLGIAQLGNQQLVPTGLVLHLNPQPVGGIGNPEGGLTRWVGLPGGIGEGANIGQLRFGAGVFPVLEMAFNRFF